MIESYVFVSHASSDDEIVRKLREGLPDVDFWADNRELTAGDDLDPEIRAAIDKAAHLVVIQSLAARLVAAVADDLANGESAAVASQLADLGGRPDLLPEAKALVPVLQQIVEGSHDPSLASMPGLYFTDAVEVQLLLERLG